MIKYFLPAFTCTVMIHENNTLQAKTPDVYDWKNHTILVVEDEEINYFYIKEILLTTNINLLYADNGFAAIEECKKNPGIDLVLMDIKMPVMSGYEATVEIKKIRPYVKVIAQTAYSISDQRAELKESGCDDYLCKPIRPDTLLQSVAKHLQV